MYDGNSGLAECTRRDQESFLFFDAIDKFDTFVYIRECIDIVDHLAQFGDGIAAIFIVDLIDISI
jgi:hypothetical protein